jgi:hypothetical protein
VRAAQRSKILDGHRSGGYARQRALSTSRNSLPRGAPFYNAWAKSSLARSGSTSKGGKTGENGGCEVAGSVAMRCAILCVIGRQFPSSKLRPKSLRETWLPSFEATLRCSI